MKKNKFQIEKETKVSCDSKQWNLSDFLVFARAIIAKQDKFILSVSNSTKQKLISICSKGDRKVAKRFTYIKSSNHQGSIHSFF